MKLSDFKILSFDCYGTLIDWETGLFRALQPLIAEVRVPVSREVALSFFADAEAYAEHEDPTALYSVLLTRVHSRLATAWSVDANPVMDRAFGDSIGDWPAFPDTVEALRYLARHFKLVILSNVDAKSFAATNARLGVRFDGVFTAEAIGSYKPDARNFEYLLARIAEMGFASHDLLHTAQSLYHDHAPAARAGIARCWINRRGDTGTGSGATKPVAERPPLDFEFPSLGAMAEAHARES